MQNEENDANEKFSARLYSMISKYYNGRLYARKRSLCLFLMDEPGDSGSQVCGSQSDLIY